MLYAVVKSLAMLLARLLFRIEVQGAEHVPRTGPAMIVANHSSVLDPPVVGAAAPRALHFMAKAELFSLPLVGWLLRALNARPVRREGADARALREALRILAGGHALLVFPEGTRGTEGTLREGKAGAGMLALLSGAPVVPAYIEGTGRALPRGRAIPRPGKVRVTFGPPLAFAKVEGPHRKERYLEASREMMAAIGRLKQAAERGMTATEIGHRRSAE